MQRFYFVKMEELKMYDKVSANRNVVESEKAVEKFWKDNDVFKKSMEIREGCPTYMFYDGPPTAMVSHISDMCLQELSRI